MVDKCANPSCETLFRYFRGGKLFVFEPREGSSTHQFPRVEHSWLCERCAPDFTIVLDGDGHPRVQSVHCERHAA